MSGVPGRQVSVRKAALTAAVVLLKELPAHPAIVNLWVAVSLPMVRVSSMHSPSTAPWYILNSAAIECIPARFVSNVTLESTKESYPLGCLLL